MNEKALLNRAKLVEKAFELSLSKVPRHSSHTQPFFDAGDFYSESVIQAVDRGSWIATAVLRLITARLFSVENPARTRINARTAGLFFIIVVHLFRDVHTD